MQASTVTHALRRLWPALLLAALVVVAWTSGVHEHVSFARLEENRGLLARSVAEHPLLASLAFASCYAASTALSLPIGTILSVAGGFLFGIVWGTSLIVVGATLGASAVFAVARSSLGTFLREKARDWQQRMQRGFARNAWSYMLFLRLMPVFPFWLVNIVPALLGVPFRIFAIGTAIGIVPAAAVFASLGNGLDAVFAAGESPDAGIVFSPRVFLPLVGLALLALLPIVYRRWSAGRQGPCAQPPR